MDSNVYINENAVVDSGAVIQSGTKIWHFCHLMNCKVGKNCSFGQNVFVADNVTIGNGVKVQNNVSIYSGIVIEDDVFLGPSCVFTNVKNPRSHVNRKKEYLKTIIKKGATIGANAVIVCSNTIGEYAFVGAGSVVTKDIDDYSICVGNPAKHIGYACKCGEKILFKQNKSTCKRCGLKYIKKDEKVIVCEV